MVYAEPAAPAPRFCACCTCCTCSSKVLSSSSKRPPKMRRTCAAGNAAAGAAPDSAGACCCQRRSSSCLSAGTEIALATLATSTCSSPATFMLSLHESLSIFVTPQRPDAPPPRAPPPRTLPAAVPACAPARAFAVCVRWLPEGPARPPATKECRVMTKQGKFFAAVGATAASTCTEPAPDGLTCTHCAYRVMTHRSVRARQHKSPSVGEHIPRGGAPALPRPLPPTPTPLCMFLFIIHEFSSSRKVKFGASEAGQALG